MGARYYDSELSVWLSVDSLGDEFLSWTPYHYCHANPINMIDPDGRAANPIYDKQGEFLGTNDEGLQGEAIIMHEKDLYPFGLERLALG